MKMEYRGEYFDTCLLHNIVHDINLVHEHRPVFRVSQYSNSINIVFKPPRLRLNMGKRNPSIRSQMLYNKKFRKIDIINLNKNTFKKRIKEELMRI